MTKIINQEEKKNPQGRKLAMTKEEIIALGVFKQIQGIKTKKSIYEIFSLPCSYKTLVVNINRFAFLILIIIKWLLSQNKKCSYPVKYTDSTDIPVCLNRKAYKHKVMKGIAQWSKTGKGWFYGLKLHLTADMKKNVLSLKLTSGNINDVNVFEELNKDLNGIFVCDAGYISKAMANRFNNSKRIIFVSPRANMKIISTKWQRLLMSTRMRVEIHFNVLKNFFGLITSLPRSVNGYLANYTYSLFAYLIK